MDYLFLYGTAVWKAVNAIISLMFMEKPHRSGTLGLHPSAYSLMDQYTKIDLTQETGFLN